MNRSIGVTRVCGQLDSLPNAMRHLPASATRSSQSALRCGSSASDFTVLMPKIVSASAACFSVSACDHALEHHAHRPQEGQDDQRDDAVAQATTIQASVAFSKNRNGSSTQSVIRSSKVVISLPVMNSRTWLIWVMLVHRLAGRVPLEIVQRQADQAIEHVQVELGVDADADDQDDQPPRVAEQRLVDYGDRQDRADQEQGGIAVVGEHLVRPPS